MKTFLLLLLLLPCALPAPTYVIGGGIDWPTAHEIETLYPGEGLIVAAIATHEHGAIGYQCGNGGTTQLGKRYSFHQRNFIECARTVSKLTLKYALNQKVVKSDYFEYLAAHYLNSTPARNKEWAKSVRTIYKQLAAKSE